MTLSQVLATLLNNTALQVKLLRSNGTDTEELITFNIEGYQSIDPAVLGMTVDEMILQTSVTSKDITLKIWLVNGG